MHRLSFLSLLVLALGFFAFDAGSASAFQKKFNANPGAVWAACGANGGTGSFDPHAGVVCTNQGCDGNPKHSCIVDCTAAGKCTATTPDILSSRFTVGDVLADHGGVRRATPTLPPVSLGGAVPHGYGVPPLGPRHPPMHTGGGTFGPKVGSN